MRRLRRCGRGERGLNLIELMVALTIAGIVLLQGLPALREYMTNARLRSAGHVVLEQALFAQNEAVRRNGVVRVTINGAQLQVIDGTSSPEKVLRDIVLPGHVQAASAPAIEFGSLGRPPVLGTSYQVSLAAPGVVCGGETLCPVLRIDAGGGVRLCRDSSTTSCP